MENLYPIRFSPIIKERVWGGDRLVKLYSKDYGAGKAVGESWEISAVSNEYSVAENGFLKGNNIIDIAETYMGDLMGDNIFDKYGVEFPLLIKLLDINEKLSIQVHPDDSFAKERHNSFGKTECWYVMDAEPNAVVYLGFKRDITKDELLERIKNATLEEVLNIIHPKKGDFIFVEPGTVHSADGGVVIAEIQQVSDITYRVYDWGRENNPETRREMHVELASEVINYKKLELTEKVYRRAVGETVSEFITLTDCNYFKVDELRLNGLTKKNSEDSDSFRIYICIEGDIIISGGGEREVIEPGETILVPSAMGKYSLETLGSRGKVLEVTAK